MVRRGVVVLAVVIGCMVMVPAPAGVAASGPVHSDFNGDGLGDLAMGLPLRDVGSVSNAGAVWVLYATPRGFTQVKAELWTQNSPGIPDSAEAEEAWGTASAPADFNGDGFADLALSSTNDLGITVIFGSPSGLRGPGAQFLYESVDQYRGLAGGNFNVDGFADLAWISLSGTLYVRLGSASGLGTSGSVWTADSPGICDDGQWGDALASGDLNGDGFDDLAIGDRTENVEGAQEAGQIQVLY